MSPSARLTTPQSKIRDARPHHETTGSSAYARGRTVTPVFTTMLTKRRAVDHCRVHSALCRAS